MVVKSRLKSYFPLIASLFLGAILFFLVDDFVRTVIILPFLRVFWFFSLFVRSLPQGVIWIVFILIMMLITLASLGKGVKSLETTSRTLPKSARTVERWARLMEYAPNSRYSKWRLAQELKQLTLRVLSPHDPEEKNKHDLSKLDLPPEINAYFEARHPYGDSVVGRLRKRNHKADATLEMDPEVIYQYLKERLDGYDSE